MGRWSATVKAAWTEIIYSKGATDNLPALQQYVMQARSHWIAKTVPQSSTLERPLPQHAWDSLPIIVSTWHGYKPVYIACHSQKGVLYLQGLDEAHRSAPPTARFLLHLLQHVFQPHQRLAVCLLIDLLQLGADERSYIRQRMPAAATCA